MKDVLANGGDWIEVRGAKKHIKGYLKEFLFDPSLTEAPIGSLSGGERSRLLLAREFAREANLLVLDEPTNDLDLETLDLLQEVIADYDGTVLIVSHDRDFLDRTVTITLGLDGSGKVDIVAGGYEDWVRQRYEAVRSPAKAGAQGACESSAFRRSWTPACAGEQESSLQGPARLRSTAGRDRAAPGRSRVRRAGTIRSRPLCPQPDRFAQLTERIARHRADIEAAELRWLEVAEMAEALTAAR